MSLGVLFKVQPPGASADGPSSLLFDGVRIPRETFRVMRRADEILREAEGTSAHLLARSAEAAEKQGRQAWEQGFARGRIDGFAAVLGSMEVEQRLRDRMSHRLADIVEHCVRNLIGEHSEGLLMRDRVLHLLRIGGVDRAASEGSDTVAGASSAQSGAVLHVGPAQLAAAHAIVAEFSGAAGTFAGLSIVADERLSPGDLLLETPTGFVESNLQLTLAEMRALLQQALDQALRLAGASS